MKIAIKANPNRGKEIISLLESLGGINNNNWIGDGDIGAYYIDKNNMIRYDYTPIDYEVYTLEEFETQFSFKIGDKIRDCSDDEIGVITDLTFIDNMLIYNVDFVNSGQAFMPSETLKYYKEMKEERSIKLTFDKAQEWYKKGGELKEIALQAFSERELNPIPRSWEEYCENYPVREGECYLKPDGEIRVIECDVTTRIAKNWIPSKESAEAHLAMIQLEQLRNCWWNGWEPDWNDGQQTKYCIIHSQEFKIQILYVTRRFLSFPTIEMAEEFLKCFKDLIEKAGNLL